MTSILRRIREWGLVPLLLYPLTSLLTHPLLLLRTLARCRVLSGSKRGEYHHFDPQTGLGYLFYWTMHLNLARYGRAGRSPILGLGAYPLARWFFACPFSLGLYARNPNLVLLLSMGLWLATHVAWLFGSAHPWWAMAVLGLTACSSSFYCNLFSRQNYNVVGWACFPLGLFGLEQGFLWLAALAWLGASYGSVTVTALAGWVTLVQAIHEREPWMLITMVPAALNLATPFLARHRQDLGGYTAGAVLKGIGFTNRGVKYRFTVLKRFGAPEWYFLSLVLQYCLVYRLTTGQQAWLMLGACLLYVLNARLTRFADFQSMILLLMSLATAATLCQPSLALLASYWLLANPLPILFGFSQGRPDRMFPAAPFRFQPFLDGVRAFLAPVPSGSRVLAAYADPRGVFERCFDGYNMLAELPRYAGAEREIHLMPDWWAVLESNYPGAPEFWGREPAQVLENLRRFEAPFALIYQTESRSLDPIWADLGFQCLATFDWNDYVPYLGGRNLQARDLPSPTWFLLRPPVPVTSSSTTLSAALPSP